MLLQHLYKPLFNFLYEKITCKINDNIKKFIIFACFFLIVFIQFLNLYKSFGIITADVRDSIIIICMILVAIFSVNKRLELIKYKLQLYIPYIAVGFFILIASFDHYIGTSFRLFSIVMLTGFAGVFYVWGNRKDYDILFILFSRAYILFTIGTIAVCILFCPYFKGEWVHLYGYSIMGINPNGFTKILLPSLVSGIYLSATSNIRIEKIVSAFSTGAAGYLIFITQSRAGIMCLVLLLFTGIVFLSLKTIKSDNSKKKESVIVIAIVIISFLAMAVALQKVSPLINEPLKEPNETTQVEGTIAEEKQESIDKTYDYVLSIGDEIIGGNEFLKEVNVLSANRISIWAAYLDNMTFGGAEDTLLVWGPHNQYIELSYKTGVFTGIIWLCFNLIVGITALYQCVKTRNNMYLFQLLAFIAFFIISMLDTGVLPLNRSFIFMYYISLIPVFIKEKG